MPVKNTLCGDVQQAGQMGVSPALLNKRVEKARPAPMACCFYRICWASAPRAGTPRAALHQHGRPP